MSDVSPVPTPTPDRRNGMPWWILPALGVVSEGVFVIGLVLAYFLADATLFNVALGAAIGQATMTNNYFFGSSKGSQEKDASLAASNAKKDDVIAASTAALAVSVPATAQGAAP